MFDRMIYADTLPQAYHHALCVLQHNGDIVDCNDYNTRCKEVALSFEVGRPLKEPMISRQIPCGPEALQQYVMEMLDGIMDFEIDAGKWAYTYHDRIAPQIPRIIEMLENDKTTRHAYIDVRRESDIYLDDPPCLTSIQYLVRSTGQHPNGQLNCYVQFRSNDGVRATFMNAFALIMLQKRIADALNLPVGTYYHRATSFHAYETSWSVLEKYVADIMSHNRELTYDYEGDWKEQMEEAIPGILKKVEEQKEKSLGKVERMK